MVSLITPLAYKLEQFGSLLQKPTQAVVGELEFKTIFTTNEILASHYNSAYLVTDPKAAALAKRVKQIKEGNRSHTIRKVLWAMSTVLPLLHLLGRFCQTVARTESVRHRDYIKQKLAAEKTEQLRKTTLLRDSFNEFMQFTVNMNQLANRMGPTFNLHEAAHILRKRFVCKVEMMKEMTQSLLTLLHESFKVTPERMTKDVDDCVQWGQVPPSDNEVPLVVYNCLHKLYENSTPEASDFVFVHSFFSCSAERGSGSYYHCLQNSKDRFIALCNKRLSM